MSGKKIAWLTLLLAAVAAGIYGYKEFTRTNKQLINAKPDYTMTASALINDFENDDNMATTRYNGKVLEVSGSVLTVEIDDSGYYTVILGEQGTMSAVRCSIDSTQQANAARIKAGSSVLIRGACTGFNKDEMGLGADVILNRCAVIK